MRNFSFGVVVATFLSSAALAADMPVKAPPPAVPVCNWCGFYIGVNGGGAWGTTGPSLSANNSTIPFFATVNIPGVDIAGTATMKNSGGLAGGQVGYLWQVNKAIIGVEAGIDWMNLRASRSIFNLYTAAFPNGGFTINQSEKSDWLATFLGRIGFDMGSWQPYATGGFAVANLKYGFNYTDTVFAPTCACAASFSQTKLGYAIGAGAEWKFAPQWSVRGEYLYIAFDPINATSVLTGQPPNSAVGSAAFFVHNVTFSENIARVAVSYSFGPGWIH
jgi:outer membrane immunogenic protein